MSVRLSGQRPEPESVFMVALGYQCFHIARLNISGFNVAHWEMPALRGCTVGGSSAAKGVALKEFG